MVRDPSRAVYRYHQTFNHDGRTLTRKLLIAAIQLSPWTEGSVRPHEATDPAAREAADRAIRVAGAYTEAVLAGYRDAPNEIDRLMRDVEGGRPTVDVTTGEGTRHRVWRVSSAEVIGKLRPLFAPKKLHVLDGHGRYEAMVAYRDHLAESHKLLTYASANFGLGCLVNVADPALGVTARHRILRGEGLTRDAVLATARRWFIVDKLAGAAKDVAVQLAALADTHAHQPAFVATFAGDPDAWKLTLSPDISPVAEGVAVDRALQKYDPVVLDGLFIPKVAPGAKSTSEVDESVVVARVAAGAELGLITRPLTMEQLLHTDQLGQVLPSGSTAFVPPLANLVSYIVDPDEDLV